MEIDIEELVDDYIKFNLNRCINEVLETLDESYMYENYLDEESFNVLQELEGTRGYITYNDALNLMNKESIKQLEKDIISSLNDYEDIFRESYREEVLELCDDLYDNKFNEVKSFIIKLRDLLNESQDKVIFTYDIDSSRSWSPGRFVSQYFKLMCNDEDVLILRYCDGHYNGRDDNQLEINAFDELSSFGWNGFITDVCDVIDDLFYNLNIDSEDLKEDTFDNIKQLTKEFINLYNSHQLEF